MRLRHEVILDNEREGAEEKDEAVKKDKDPLSRNVVVRGCSGNRHDELEEIGGGLHCARDISQSSKITSTMGNLQLISAHSSFVGIALIKNNSE